MRTSGTYVRLMERTNRELNKRAIRADGRACGSDMELETAHYDLKKMRERSERRKEHPNRQAAQTNKVIKQ